jgi:hypothetical protein
LVHPAAAAAAATPNLTALPTSPSTHQPGQISLPGHMQLMRGASALLTGVVLPERPAYISAELSRRSSRATRTTCDFEIVGKVHNRTQTQDSIGFMPPSQHALWWPSAVHSEAASPVSGRQHAHVYGLSRTQTADSNIAASPLAVFSQQGSSPRCGGPAAAASTHQGPLLMIGADGRELSLLMRLMMHNSCV